MHTWHWQAGFRDRSSTFGVGPTNAKCSLRPLLLGLPDPERCTRRLWAGAAQKVRPQSRNAVTRTLCIESRSPASVRRASTRADGHLMMSCGRERRAAANERLQHSGATQPLLSTQRAASCAQRCPTYHPVHVRFMLCASCADVMDKRYRGGATKLVCWRPLNMMWQLACKRSFNGEADLACPSLTPVLAGTSTDGPNNLHDSVLVTLRECAS